MLGAIGFLMICLLAALFPKLTALVILGVVIVLAIKNHPHGRK